MDANPQPSPETMHSPLKMYNVFVVCAMSFGSLSFGYSNVIIATTFAQPTFLEYFHFETRSNASQLEGAITGGYYAAAFLAVFLVGFIADRWGRKSAVAVGAVTTLIAGALLAGSVNIAMFVVCRFISGAGASILLASVPLWMNEVVPAKDRGPLVDIHGAVFQVGFAMASWVGYGFYFLTARSTNTWRAPLAFQCLPPLITLAILPFLPESPRWLLVKDRIEEARQVLLRSHSAEESSIELSQIHAQMQKERGLNNSYLHIFRTPSYRKRAVLAICTCFMANCSGILVVNNYGPTIYASLGYNNSKQLLLSAVWSTFGIFCSFVGLTFVDRLSRPRLLSLGLFGSMSCLIILAALIARVSDNTNAATLKAAVAFIFVYAFFWSGVLSGTQFVYCGELFPSHLRAKGVSLAVASINLTNVLFLTVAPVAFSSIGWKFYLVFIITSGVSAIIILFFWPDTRGLRLEAIDALFGDKAVDIVGATDEDDTVGGAAVLKMEKSSDHTEYAEA